MVKKLGWRLLTFMMVTMMGVCFVSCGDDDDDDTGGKSAEELIVGTWANEDNETMEFKADGTCTYEKVQNVVLFEMKERKTGKYTIKDDKLTTKWTKFETWNPASKSWMETTGDKNAVVTTFSISKKKLTFTEENGKKIEKPVVLTKK